MGALASSGSPWDGWGEGLVLSPTPARLRTDMVSSQELMSPHCRDPFPTSFTGPLSSQPPSDVGNQVREGKRGWGGGWLCLPSPAPFPRLPVCCPCPFCSSEPAEAEKEKAGTGPAQTSGCRDLRLWSKAGGHPYSWLGQRRARTDVPGGQGTISGRRHPHLIP